MRKARLLLIASFSLFLFSCQKELTSDLGAGSGATNAKLVGNYKFVNLHAITFASNESTIAGITQKTETTSDYISINNVGTTSFTSTAMSSNNIGYGINSSSFNKVYENGALIDTFTLPLVATVPVTSASSNYTVISADSIIVQNAPGSSQSTSGAKLRFSNDTLFMTQRLNESSVQTVSGVSVKMTRNALLVTTLKKL